MSQTAIRIDPMLGHRTLFSLRRAARPVGVYLKYTTSEVGECPFCAENEHLTPATLLVVPSLDHPKKSDAWQVRVVPNLYPALGTDHAEDAGYHEVIIESPDHLTRFTQLDSKHVSVVLQVYRDRLSALRRETKIVHAVVFKNEGAEAGASLAHVHSQLMALPYVPEGIRKRLEFNRHYAEQHGQTYFEAEIDNARRDCRIVWESDDLVAICPYASRFPYETWIVPIAPTFHFEDSSASLLEQLAEGWLRVVKAYEAIVPEGAYNMVLQSAPFRGAEPPAEPFDSSSFDHYHWHMELLPRVAMLAGFEYGTGDYINTVFPETAAAKLRENLRSGITS